MPTLHWIGKDKVINHHREVPYKVLEHGYGFDAVKGKTKQPTSSGNMVIHGDNLEALKSLLPQYEGKVKCIYIDPPYNTGNEGWVYNDNVNDPRIKKWLGDVVGKEGEDLSRHDKWLCMMYPRISLLRRLLTPDGVIAISIDDNELDNLIIIMNELFGAKQRVAICPWKSEPSGGKGKGALRVGHEYLVIYCAGDQSGFKLEEKPVEGTEYEDEFGPYVKGRELSKWGSESLRSDREDMYFGIATPSGDVVYPIRNDGLEGRWRWGSKNHEMMKILNNPAYAHWEIRAYDEGVVVDGKTERMFPYEKIRKTKKSFGWSSWLDNHGTNADGTKEIKAIFGNKDFDTPKPLALIEWVLNLTEDDRAIVLDSFAGSGTTAHAVLNLNKQDGGNRKFILIEMMDYAETITAERVKRVMYGYGEGNKKTEGTGGAFDYYTLGQPLFNAQHNLNEEVGTEKIREYIWYSETRTALAGIPGQARNDGGYYLGTHERTAFYFVYEKEALTTLDHELLATLTVKGERTVIYADNCLLPKKFLEQHGIVFKKIPRDISRF